MLLAQCRRCAGWAREEPGRCWRGREETLPQEDRLWQRECIDRDGAASASAAEVKRIDISVHVERKQAE